MADELGQGLGLEDDELQRRGATLAQLQPLQSPAAPALSIPPPSAQDKTPPLTLRGVSPQLSQRTAQDEAQNQALQRGSGIAQIHNPVGRGVLRGLDIAGSIAAPRLMMGIPGTQLHHQGLVAQNRANLAQDTGEQEKEAQTAHLQQETKNLQNPPEKPPKKPDEIYAQAVQEAVDAGRDPNQDPKVKQLADTVTALQKQPQIRPGEEPATPADVQGVTQMVAGSPYLTPEQKQEAAFPPGYKPTASELKTRTELIKNMEGNARSAHEDKNREAQEKFNDQMRGIMVQNSSLLAQAHLADEAEKRKQAETKDVMAADAGYAGLYAQDRYHDAVVQWHKSGHFAKDSGIVDSIVNQAHGANGLPSIGGGATIGALIGGVGGAAVGAAVPAISGLLMPMANGYLDAAKRAGISNEGYEAMQAYFNALPPRMAYEITVQGIPASVMRSRDMIQKIMQTVPPPNTPDNKFEKSFGDYYGPMKATTEKKARMIAPPGYQPPAREQFYPPEQNAGGKDLGPAPQGKAEGSTGKLPDGTKVVVQGGRLVTQ